MAVKMQDVRRIQDPVLSMFLKQMKALRLGPIRLILFGSRAREDWRPDSDYDILIVVPRKDSGIKDRLYDGVIDVLLETGKLISLKVFDEKRFEALQAIPTPFMANVMNEGVEIGFDE